MEKKSNFGDQLNPWIWPRLLPGIFEGECFHSSTQKLQNEKENSLFLGIGTILNNNVPMRPLKAVFGTGFGYGKIATIDDKWKFYCVRGPLSAKALGLASKLAITGSAALLRVVELPKVSKLQHKFSFMPHFHSHKFNNYILEKICEVVDINYIEPTGDVEAVFEGILSSEVVIAEAMHGAIVADALRIPWIQVKTDDFILEFKWQDWCQSLGLDYQPITIPYSFWRIMPKTRWSGKGNNIVKKKIE